MSEKWIFEGSQLPPGAAEIIGQVIFRWQSLERLIRAGIEALDPARLLPLPLTSEQGAGSLQANTATWSERSTEALPDFACEIREVAAELDRLEIIRDDLACHLQKVIAKDTGELVFYVNRAHSSKSLPSTSPHQTASATIISETLHKSLSLKSTWTSQDVFDAYLDMGAVMDQIVTINVRSMGFAKRPHTPTII